MIGRPFANRSRRKTQSGATSLVFGVRRTGRLSARWRALESCQALRLARSFFFFLCRIIFLTFAQSLAEGTDALSQLAADLADAADTEDEQDDDQDDDPFPTT